MAGSIAAWIRSPLVSSRWRPSSTPRGTSCSRRPTTRCARRPRASRGRASSSCPSWLVGWLVLGRPGDPAEAWAHRARCPARSRSRTSCSSRRRTGAATCRSSIRLPAGPRRCWRSRSACSILGERLSPGGVARRRAPARRPARRPAAVAAAPLGGDARDDRARGRVRAADRRHDRDVLRARPRRRPAGAGLALRGILWPSCSVGLAAVAWIRPRTASAGAVRAPPTSRSTCARPIVGGFADVQRLRPRARGAEPGAARGRRAAARVGGRADLGVGRRSGSGEAAGPARGGVPASPGRCSCSSGPLRCSALAQLTSLTPPPRTRRNSRGTCPQRGSDARLRLGYKASAEQFHPRRLLDLAIAAERAGYRLRLDERPLPALAPHRRPCPERARVAGRGAQRRRRASPSARAS